MICKYNGFFGSSIGFFRNNQKRMFWGCYEPRNFGDWVGPYLYLKVSGDCPVHSWTHWYTKAEVLFTAGSVVRNIGYADRAVVWGSGIISSRDEFAKPKRTLAVRGPLTRRRFMDLGFYCPEVYGDPAILLPKVYSPNKNISYEVGIIPHYKHYDEVRLMFDGVEGLRVIDVTRAVEDVVDDIVSCELLVSSSLHGVIVAHAFGRKAAWISGKSSIMGDGVKFWDYAKGIGHKFVFPQYPVSSLKSKRDLISVAKSQSVPDLGYAQRSLADLCPFGSI